MNTYLTREGDTIDFVCWKFYGSTANKVVESVLDANFGLADYGAQLPAGLAISLPELTEPSKTQGVKLWD